MQAYPETEALVVKWSAAEVASAGRLKANADGPRSEEVKAANPCPTGSTARRGAGTVRAWSTHRLT